MHRLAHAIATVAGVGYAPVAPGTFGSLVVLPALPALAGVRGTAPLTYVVAVLVVIGLAIWAAGRVEDEVGHDHGAIVVDEVAGMVVAGAFIPGTWGAAGLAFLLFRLFDVVKPFPANAIDANVDGGLGVVGDDLVAGVYAGLAARGVLAVL